MNAGAGVESRHAPEVGAALSGEKEVDLLEMAPTVVAGDAFGFHPKEADGGAIGKRVPGVLGRVALLDGAAGEIDGAGLMGVAFGGDDFASDLGVGTVLPEEVVEELIEAVTALRRDVVVIAGGDFEEVAIEK